MSDLACDCGEGGFGEVVWAAGPVWREAPARWPEPVAMEETVLGAGAAEAEVQGRAAVMKRRFC